MMMMMMMNKNNNNNNNNKMSSDKFLVQEVELTFTEFANAKLKLFNSGAAYWSRPIILLRSTTCNRNRINATVRPF